MYSMVATLGAFGVSRRIVLAVGGRNLAFTSTSTSSASREIVGRCISVNGNKGSGRRATIGWASTKVGCTGANCGTDH